MTNRPVPLSESTEMTEEIAKRRPFEIPANGPAAQRAEVGQRMASMPRTVVSFAFVFVVTSGIISAGELTSGPQPGEKLRPSSLYCRDRTGPSKRKLPRSSATIAITVCSYPD